MVYVTMSDGDPVAHLSERATVTGTFGDKRPSVMGNVVPN